MPSRPLLRDLEAVLYHDSSARFLSSRKKLDQNFLCRAFYSIKRSAAQQLGKNLVAALGDPMADRFSVEDFAAYRTKRIEQGISLNNLNREHAYLRAVFNELATLGYWKKENPLAKLRQFKIPVVSQRLSEERELIWLETWV